MGDKADGTSGGGITGSLRKVVRTRALQHPLTLYPVAVGLLGTLGFALFGAPVAAGVAAVGLSVGAGNWLTQNFLRSDKVAAEHLRQTREQLERKKAELLVQLEARLKKSVTTVDTGREYADQAFKQFRMIQKRFDTLQKLLDDKFAPGELTYGRYFVAGEQAYLSVLDNLDSIAARLHSINTIDLNYHEERLRALSKLRNPVPADQQELKTLQERAALREAQLDKINTLLTFNETAVTEFDRVNTAIAGVKGGKHRVPVDLETAIRELETLAQRAHRLSV